MLKREGGQCTVGQGLGRLPGPGSASISSCRRVIALICLAIFTPRLSTATMLRVEKDLSVVNNFSLTLPNKKR